MISDYKLQHLNNKDFHEHSLEKYIEWESTTESIVCDHIDSLEIIQKNKITDESIDKFLRNIKLIIKIGGSVFSTPLSTQIIHQLGSRIWRQIWSESENKFEYIDIYSENYKKGEEVSLLEIYQLIEILIKTNQFESKISLYITDVFQKFDLVLYYFPSKEKQPNPIYGIVSNSYKPLNQSVFRTRFLDECNRSGLKLDLKTSKQYKHRSIESIFEFIKTQHTFLSDDIDLSLVIEYGKNNGYRSYRFHWLVSIKESEDEICMIKSKYNWRNNPRDTERGFDYDKFIRDIVQEGVVVLKGIENKIKLLKKTELNKDNQVRLFIDKIKVAKATQERIYNLWIEKDNNNLWDFVKSLVQFSNNYKSCISNNMNNLVKKSMINIIEDGFDVLKKWGEEGSVSRIK